MIYRFQGPGAGHVSLPSGSLVIGSNDFAIELFARFFGESSTNYYGICGENYAANGWALYFRNSGLELWRTSGRIGPAVTGLFTRGAWHHVTISRSGTNVYYGVDGAVSLLTSAGGGSWGVSGVSQLFTSSAGLPLIGDLSHVAWHATAKFTTNYTVALPTNPTRWWKLDDAGLTTAIDSAGSAHGTYTGNIVKVEWPLGESSGRPLSRLLNTGA